MEQHGILPALPISWSALCRWRRQSRDGGLSCNLRGSIIPDWIIERMDKASDPKAEGEADLPRPHLEGDDGDLGSAGAHIMAPLNDAAITRVIAQGAPRGEEPGGRLSVPARRAPASRAFQHSLT